MWPLSQSLSPLWTPPKIAVAAGYSSVVLADSPIGYWRLGETSGTAAADSSGNSHNGTYNGTFTLGQTGALAGDSNTSVLFGGGNVDVGTTTAFELTGDVTFETWIKTTSTALSVIFGFYDTGSTSGVGLGYSINAAGKPDFWDKANNAWKGCPTAVNDGNWHHLVAAQSGAAVTWYVDGSSVGTSAVSATRSFSTSGFGKRLASTGGGGFPISATLDEMAFYSGALSSARVLAHYNAGH